MMNKCLYCYKDLASGLDYHPECSLSFYGTSTPPTLEYSLDEMNHLAKQVIERRVSVPGVQPKLSMSLFDDEIHATQRLTIVGALGGNYIFKPPSSEFIEMPENESLTMKMASLFGINTVPNALIRLQSGELSYITKRVDREENGSKIHMIDMFQIVEATDKYKGSMERIGKAITTYADNTLLDSLHFFELTLFCFLTGNNDMHYKNFSLIKTSYGWTLSPAYDLLNVAIANPDDDEEMALHLAGKKRKITLNNLVDFGKGLGLNNKQINVVFKRFFKLKSDALTLIDISFLSSKMKLAYIEVINNRYKRIN